MMHRRVDLCLPEELDTDMPVLTASAQDPGRRMTRSELSFIFFFPSFLLSFLPSSLSFPPHPWHMEVPGARDQSLTTAVTLATAVTIPDP